MFELKAPEAPKHLSDDQKKFWDLYFTTKNNLFLSGNAGTGKSHLINEIRKLHDIPILASTGAAAILVKGKTFHSYFRIFPKTERSVTILDACNDGRLKSRLFFDHTLIIDEVSMLDGETLSTAEEIARRVTGRSSPWGGIRIIAVGDFAQLQPVSLSVKDEITGLLGTLAFKHEIWNYTGFKSVVLKQTMRTTDVEFINVLNDVRIGEFTPRVESFLNEKTISKEDAEEIDATRIFTKNDKVLDYNMRRLFKIPGDYKVITPETYGDSERVFRSGAVDKVMSLKVGALIMTLVNKLADGYANGTQGHIISIDEDVIVMKRVIDGELVEISRNDFTATDAQGEIVGTVSQFPVTLAWAITAHRAQGATLERVVCDMGKIFCPGQAYVMMSRCRSSAGLHILNWNREGIELIDDSVRDFYKVQE